MFSLNVPTPTGNLNISVEPGSSVIIVGANGSGKSRLAAEIETKQSLRAHRISAHRMLILDTDIPKISEELAIEGLLIGGNISRQNVGVTFDPLDLSNKKLTAHRNGFRWQHKSNAPLNDFSFLLQFLFAEQANTAVNALKRFQKGETSNQIFTKIDILSELWERLLPQRKLEITADNIFVSPIGLEQKYKASDLSDGERAIFYLIGQTLVAPQNTLLIFDEPELHVHRSIMSKLWDELETARPDCAFVFITHDLEFAATRVAQKYFIREYNSNPDSWKIEEVPENTGFNEEITTLILGSRKPILFVEGDETSLDCAIYRCCFSDWTVIPRGACEVVIHSVASMRANADLTRVTCAGIVDADDYSPVDIQNLNQMGVAVLPVSEIENLILLPDVAREIATSEGFQGDELRTRLEKLKNAVFTSLNSQRAIEEVVVRYCRRRIDRTLKKIDFSTSQTIAELQAEYARETAALDIAQLADQVTQKINDAIRDQNLSALLSVYDNKGLMALAATHLKNTNKNPFEGWLTRALRGNQHPALVAAIRNQLPPLTAQ